MKNLDKLKEEIEIANKKLENKYDNPSARFANEINVNASHENEERANITNTNYSSYNFPLTNNSQNFRYSNSNVAGNNLNKSDDNFQNNYILNEIKKMVLKKNEGEIDLIYQVKKLVDSERTHKTQDKVNIKI